MKSIYKDFYKINNYCYFPKVIQLEVTKQCSLNCPQCYKALTGTQDMEISVLENVLEEIIQHEPVVLMINGGEPFEYKYINNLLCRLISYNIATYIYTSGMKIQNIPIDYLLADNINIDVSLNGSTEKINNLSREGYNVAINALEYLKENKIKFGITWVARHDNIKDFDNLVKLACNYNADHIQIIGNKINRFGNIDSEMTQDDYRKLIEKIHFYDNKSIKIIRQQCFTNLAVAEGKRYVDMLTGCMAGKLSMCIDINGLFAPCMHLFISEKYNSILEYWQHSPLLNQLRSIKQSELKNCENCIHNSNCNFCRGVSYECKNNLKVGPAVCQVKNIVMK